jgi:hypothetical protein
LTDTKIIFRDLYTECQDEITTMPEPVWIDDDDKPVIKREVMIKTEPE